MTSFYECDLLKVPTCQNTTNATECLTKLRTLNTIESLAFTFEYLNPDGITAVKIGFLGDEDVKNISKQSIRVRFVSRESGSINLVNNICFCFFFFTKLIKLFFESIGKQ